MKKLPLTTLVPAVMLFLCASCYWKPGVTITAPDNATAYDTGSHIRLSARIYEPDGAIAQVRWVSSRDGLLSKAVFNDNGTTAQTGFTTSALSPGIHDIYCFAYGSQRLLSGDCVTITIGTDNQSDDAYIILASPLDGWGFNEGDSVRLYAEAGLPGLKDGVDEEDLVWSSDYAGTIGAGFELTTKSFSAGTHAITAAVTADDQEEVSASVTISVYRQDTPVTTTVPETTTSMPAGETTTTSIAGSVFTTTTSASAAATTSISGSETSSTTTTARQFDCPPDAPIGCVDPDYDPDQYWCCEVDTTCGKVVCENGNCKGTCIPLSDNDTSTTTSVVSTTTTSAAPERTTLYVSPDEESDLLFYIHHRDGTKMFYNGSAGQSGMALSFVSSDAGNAVIFSDDFYPVQWIMEGFSAAVYLTGEEEYLDPHNAYHEVTDGSEFASYTLDIYPDDLSAILTQMEEKTGEEFPDAAEFLTNYGIDSFSELTTLAKQAGSDQARYIAAAAAFGAAASYLSMEAADAASARAFGGRITICSPLKPIIQYHMKFLASLLSSKFNDEFGPQPPTDPDDPGVEVQLCRGQSSISQICHYMFFRPSYPGSAGPCVDLCVTSMKCFTDICMPMTLSTQSAEDFKGHFYN